MRRLLIVEDNELNRDMLTRRLQRHGFEIITAEDGLEGVRLAELQCPHLVLMDLSLPVLDGWEAIRRLRAGARSATIPIIALTAHALQSEHQEALRAGCDDVDTKPVDLQRLLGKIEALLYRAAVQRDDERG